MVDSATIYTLNEPQGAQINGETVGAVISSAGGFGPTSNTDTKIVSSEVFPLINNKGGETVYPRADGFFLRSAIYKNKFYEGLRGGVYPDQTADEPIQLFFTNDNALSLQPDKEMWIGFSIYVPYSFENENSASANLGVQRTRLFTLEPPDDGRSIALISITKDSLSNTTDNIWLLSYYADSSSVTESSSINLSLGYVKDDIGKWTDFVIRVRWNPFSTTTNPVSQDIVDAVNQTFEGNKGILEVWKSVGEPNISGNRQMNKVFSLVNQPVGNVPGYQTGTIVDRARLKWGPFKYSWKKVAGSTVTGPIWFGFDEIKYGYADDGVGYATVLPQSTVYQPPVLPGLPPTAPVLTAQANPSNPTTQINLSWTASTVSSGTITNYFLDRQSGTTWTNIYTGLNRAFTDINLTPDTTYSYRVRALASNNQYSSYSTASVKTNAAPVSTIYIIPASAGDGTRIFDGTNLSHWSGIGPARLPTAGDIIEFAAGTHSPVRFQKLVGVNSNRITIRGPQNGRAIIRRSTVSSGYFVLTLDQCRHITINGLSNDSGVVSGPDGLRRSILITYASTASPSTPDAPNSFIRFRGDSARTDFSLTRDITIQGIEIDGGYNAYNEPQSFCTDGIGIATNDQNLLYNNYPTAWQENMAFLYNYIHNVEGEGMYIGPNVFTDTNTWNVPLRNIEIAHNYVVETGWDGLNGKMWWGGTNSMHHNIVLRCGWSTTGKLQSGENTGITCAHCSWSAYNNWIEDSGEGGIRSWTDILIPSSFLTQLIFIAYNNVVVRSGYNGNQKSGIKTVASGTSIKATVYNNTIIAATEYGVRFGTNTTSDSICHNNIALDCAVANISAFNAVGNLATGSASTYLVSPTGSITDTLNVRLKAAYLAIGATKAITDYYDTEREPSATDVGAVEFKSSITSATYIIPTANTGGTRTFDGANLTTGFNGSPWVTTQGATKLPAAGDVIELAAGQHIQFQLRFNNINGNSSNRITVRGPQTGTTQAVIRRLNPAALNFVWLLSNCNYMTIDGQLPSAGSFTTAPYNCGIKVTYALNSVAGLGQTNKDGPSYFIFWGDSGPAVRDATLQYVEIDGGWAYASPEIDPDEGEGSGYAYEGIGAKVGSVRLANGDGAWNERIKLLHNWCHAVQGEGFYQGRNSPAGSIPWRDHEIAYNLFEDCGGGAIHQKLILEGNNSCHHNLIRRCGLNAPTPSRWAITCGHMSTSRIYNNWIEDNALGSARVNGLGRPPGGIIVFTVDSDNVPVPGGTYLGYGPYTTQPVWIYNNVIVRSGTQSLLTAGDVAHGIRASTQNGSKLKHTVYIFNNTILDNYGNGIDVGDKVDGGFIKNNIVLGNVSGQIVTEGVAPASNNNTTASPNTLFVNYSSDDFRLASPNLYPAVGTIGVDIASSGFGVKRSDQFDTSRPVGTTADIGAYETQSSVSPGNATYIIPTANTGGTRTYNGSNLSTGFNGSPWVTTQGATKLPAAGDVIELAAGEHIQFQLFFSNLNGTTNNPIVVRGPQTGTTQAVIRRLNPAALNFVWRLTNCTHLTIDGYLPTAGSSTQAPYNCGIKVTYAKNSVKGLGTANKDGPSYYIKWHNSPVRYATVKHCEIDGGWEYASPEDDPGAGDGSGYAYEGIGVGLGSGIPADGAWNENIKILYNWIHGTQGEGIYTGSNSRNGEQPHRNVETAYNLIEDCGGGAIHQKCFLEGDNICHHNLLRRCGQNSPTPSRISITGQLSATRIYNNWIEETASTSTRLNDSSGGRPDSIQLYVTQSPNVPNKNGLFMGFYGPYSTQVNHIYNNVVIRGGNSTLMATPGNQSHGISVGAADSSKLAYTAYIYNNTILDNWGKGININYADGGFIKNNIVLGNQQGNIDNSILSASNNLTSADVNSLFVNYSADNFLLSNADLHPAVGTIGTDIASTAFGVKRNDGFDPTRPVGTTADIGAYETQSSISSGVVTTGLISYLDSFNTSSYPLSGNTWFDLSPSQVNFTAVNGAFFGDDKTFVLDGVNDYINTGASVLNLNANTGGDRTVELWFKLLSWPSNGSQTYPTRGVLLGGAMNGTGVLSLEGAGTNLGKMTWLWDDSSPIWTNTNFQLGVWYQIVLLFKSPRLVTYYVNGVLDTAEFQTNDAIVNELVEWNIGRSSRSYPTKNATSTTAAEGPYYFLNVNCETAIFRQYSRLLTSSEIAQNYNADKNKFSQTVVSPSAPILTAQANSTNPTTQINLSWTASTISSGTITNYFLEKQSGTTWTNIYTGLNQTFTDINLTPDTTYSYRVRALASNNQYSSYSTASAKTSVSSIIFNGDFSTGDFTQWKTPSEPDVRLWQIPVYGRPIQYGGQNAAHVGNGELLSLVAATTRTVNGVFYPQGPTRGSSPYAAKFTVKNSANGVEPNDCDPSTSCLNRRAMLQGESITGQTGWNSMPYGSERWISASFYIPSHWQNAGSGWGRAPGFGLKPQGVSPLPGIFHIELDGPNNTWTITHRYNAVLNSISYDDLPWWQNMRYDNASPGLPGDPDPNQFNWYDTTDFPNVAASRAALSTVTYDGWTDWVVHVKFDNRTVENGGTGFLDVYKRDGSGPWVKVLHIVPKTTSRGGRTFAHGIGYNHPTKSHGSNIGIYCAKDVAWSAPTNLVAYMANYKIGKETATFAEMSPDGSTPDTDPNKVFATKFGNGVYIDGSTSTWFNQSAPKEGSGTVFFRGGDVSGYAFPVILYGGRLDGYEYTAYQVISQTGTSTPFNRCDVNQTDHPHRDHGLYDTETDLIALPVADRPPTGTTSALKQKFVSNYRADTQTQHQLIVKPGGNNMAEQGGGFLYWRFYRKFDQDVFTNMSVNENYATLLCQTKTNVFNLQYTDIDGIFRSGTSDWRLNVAFAPTVANPTPQNPGSRLFVRAQPAQGGDPPLIPTINAHLWQVIVRNVPIFPNTWHYIEFAYRFSPNSDGFIWTAVDGVTVVDERRATLPTWTGSGNPPRQDRVFMVGAYQTNEACPRPLTQWTTDLEMFTSWPSDATTPHPL